ISTRSPFMAHPLLRDPDVLSRCEGAAPSGAAPPGQPRLAAVEAPGAAGRWGRSDGVRAGCWSPRGGGHSTAPAERYSVLALLVETRGHRSPGPDSSSNDGGPRKI